MNLLAKLRSYKAVYELYNLFHIKALKHNEKAYKEYGIKKPIYKSISSADFENLPEQPLPWLDRKDSRSLSNQELAFLPQKYHEAIRDYSKNGYVILPRFVNEELIDTINYDIDTLLNEGKIKFTYGSKLMFAFRQSKAIKSVLINSELTKVLDFLLGKEVTLFQSINFIKGSQQKPHSDSIHMTTFPLGYMIAAWVALEDISEASGPLTYIPGSHKLPYLLNNSFDHQGSKSKIGTNCYKRYEQMLEKTIAPENGKEQKFIAKKGDILIWHPNLIHGGSEIYNKKLTRKSMVAHYYAKDVIKYHEISQRPSLIPHFND